MTHGYIAWVYLWVHCLGNDAGLHIYAVDSWYTVEQILVLLIAESISTGAPQAKEMVSDLSPAHVPTL